jgi:hypothetical protein
MDLEDVEVGQRYRCDCEGAQYFATVVAKSALHSVIRSTKMATQAIRRMR